jgi:hypothetical protein
MPRQSAWEEMESSGFKSWWILRGLKSYFDKHANRPAPSLATAARLETRQPLLARHLERKVVKNHHFRSPER